MRSAPTKIGFRPVEGIQSAADSQASETFGVRGWACPQLPCLRRFHCRHVMSIPHAAQWKDLHLTSTAILIGNANYRTAGVLPCCTNDVEAMALLLQAAGRHDSVHRLTDLDGDGMREAIREALPVGSPHNEVFFYYSGHGAQVGSEFYCCGVEFDVERPNETGLSHRQLYDLVRAVSPHLFVNVFDACYSGALLVKADQPTLPLYKDGFRHVLQFSSSMDSQTSRAGAHLSAFTRAFLEASIRKREGTVYYSDVANTLRDDFLYNDDQTPFFISQGTGRELLVDDASKFAPLHEALVARWSASSDDAVERAEETSALATSPSTLSLKDLLGAADTRIAGPQEAKRLIDMIFDGVLARFQGEAFAEYFALTST